MYQNFGSAAPSGGGHPGQYSGHATYDPSFSPVDARSGGYPTSYNEVRIKK